MTGESEDWLRVLWTLLTPEERKTWRERASKRGDAEILLAYMDELDASIERPRDA